MANMERVLDIYKKPYDKDFPVVCMDESPKQLIEEGIMTHKQADGLILTL